MSTSTSVSVGSPVEVKIEEITSEKKKKNTYSSLINMAIGIPQYSDL